MAPAVEGRVDRVDRVDRVVGVSRRLEDKREPDEGLKEDIAGSRVLKVLKTVLVCALEVTVRAEKSTVPNLAREHDRSHTTGQSQLEMMLS
jgi:hypothetical protein